MSLSTKFVDSSTDSDAWVPRFQIRRQFWGWRKSGVPESNNPSSNPKPCLRASGIIIISIITTTATLSSSLPPHQHQIERTSMCRDCSSRQVGSSSSMCRDCATAHEQTEGSGGRQQRRFAACCTRRQAEPCLKQRCFSVCCTRRQAEPWLTPGCGSRQQRRFSACWSGKAC